MGVASFEQEMLMWRTSGTNSRPDQGCDKSPAHCRLFFVDCLDRGQRTKIKNEDDKGMMMIKDEDYKRRG